MKVLNILQWFDIKLVCYLQADKGNALCTIENKKFDILIEEKLNNSQFFELRRNPLSVSIKRVERTLNDCTAIVGNIAALRVPLSRIRCLPKIRKLGDKLREIIAAISQPMVNKFTNLRCLFERKIMGTEGCELMHWLPLRKFGQVCGDWSRDFQEICSQQGPLTLPVKYAWRKDALAIGSFEIFAWAHWMCLSLVRFL